MESDLRFTGFYIGGIPEILVCKVPIPSGLYVCLLKDGAVVERKYYRPDETAEKEDTA